jgi:hypothetical protein
VERIDNYSPRILIENFDKSLIEQQNATLDFYVATQARQQQNFTRVEARLKVTGRVVRHFQPWTEDGIRAGRDPLKLTWGVCIKETGILVK